MGEAAGQEEQPIQKFSLRNMLAVLWVVCAFLAAARLCDSGNFFPLFYFGLPLAVLGYKLIAWERCKKGIAAGLGVILAFGIFSVFVWPRLICPLDLPPSAWNLRASDRFVGFTGCNTHVKFYASVEDCRITARKWAEDYNESLEPPEIIRRSEVEVSIGEAEWRRHRSIEPRWFDPHRIERGERYQIGSTDIWIDTERGILYYQCYF